MDSLIFALENAQRELVACWFPRCLDASGGFFQEFAFDWTRLPDRGRGLVYQSRMTWYAATLAASGDASMVAVAEHGLEYLVSRFRDEASHSYRWSIEPFVAGSHVYGLSFALYALAAVARLGNSEALEMAKELFGWLESEHHDSEFGGYIEMIGEGRDLIGTPAGAKSQNTHLHLVESFTELAKIWPDPMVILRLEEVTQILLNELYHDGRLHLFAQRDWTPIPGGVSYGHDVEAAHLIFEAQAVLPTILSGEDKCRALVDFALTHGWDDEFGGFYAAGDWSGAVTDTTKNWWVNAEGLLGLARLFAEAGDVRYEAKMHEIWAWISAYQIDREHGGWISDVARDGSSLGLLAKGNGWKAAYHDGRALRFTADILRGMGQLPNR